MGKRIIILIIVVTSLFPIFLIEDQASAQQEAWVARYNNNYVNEEDEATDIAVDSSGNVYVTGRSKGLGTSYDFTTIKYDSEGNKLWVARYNGTGNREDGGYGIAVDNTGNVYVTGYSYDSRNSYDFLTIKYDTNGNELWKTFYNSPANGSDVGLAIALDGLGNIYVTGWILAFLLYSDYATIKYDNNGNELWVSRYSGPMEHDFPHDMAVDSSGNVYVTGESFGMGTALDYATVKYDNNGNELWASRYNGRANSYDHAIAIVVDDAGNSYVTGDSSWGVTSYDYITIKYDFYGNEVWVSRYNGMGDKFDYATALAIDASGNLYVTGYSARGESGVEAEFDYATIKYDNDGNELWVSRYNSLGDGSDYAWDLALDGSGNVFITGYSYHENGAVPTYVYTTMKYDNNGNELWVANYNEPKNMNIPTALAVDSSGNAYVTGFSFGGDTNFDYLTIKYMSVIK